MFYFYISFKIPHGSNSYNWILNKKAALNIKKPNMIQDTNMTLQKTNKLRNDIDRNMMYYGLFETIHYKDL